MNRMRFGAFIAPHHPVGEHPMLLFQRDLDLVEHLDRLGFDEFWCGEHHSTGWETIASPEMFLAAAGQRSHRIRLGTGVISLPYHHPFNVAQRLVQLDHMTGGRALFGSGPGALGSDADTLGIDPMTQRDRQDEALGVIRRLLAGEPRFSHESDWFRLRDAALQLLPLQEQIPMVVASMISPWGMTLAGRHGTGVLSVGSTSTAGLEALPTQWAFAEDAAAEHGRTMDRADWRVVMNWHIAETRELARTQAGRGLMHWHNDYTVRTMQRPGAEPFRDPEEALDRLTGDGTAVIGTPDDLVRAIHDMIDRTGGFGTLVGFSHDWARPADNRNSWDLVARYVIPEINGHLRALRASQAHVIEHRAAFDRAGEAVRSKIMENDRARAALDEEPDGAPAFRSPNVPDLRK
jgi:limonene 1,2-monooxygenase